MSCRLFHLLLLTSSLCVTSLQLNGELIKENQSILSSTGTEELTRQCSRSRKNCSDARLKKIRPLQLKDFEGEWIHSAISAGGLAGPDDVIGISHIAELQISMGKKGLGRINGGSISNYLGVRGVLPTYDVPNTDTVEIVIIDAKHSIGKLILYFKNFFNSGLEKTVIINFIATRSKESGKVTSIIGHRVLDGTVDASLAQVAQIRWIKQCE